MSSGQGGTRWQHRRMQRERHRRSTHSPLRKSPQAPTTVLRRARAVALSQAGERLIEAVCRHTGELRRQVLCLLLGWYQDVLGGGARARAALKHNVVQQREAQHGCQGENDARRLSFLDSHGVARGSCRELAAVHNVPHSMVAAARRDKSPLQRSVSLASSVIGKAKALASRIGGNETPADDSGQTRWHGLRRASAAASV